MSDREVRSARTLTAVEIYGARNRGSTPAPTAAPRISSATEIYAARNAAAISTLDEKALTCRSVGARAQRQQKESRERAGASRASARSFGELATAVYGHESASANLLIGSSPRGGA
jgi:hypothetical protein